MKNHQIISSRNFSRRPAWFNFLNHGWSATYPLGTKIKLEKDDLIVSARKKTGLTDLGREFWDEPLDHLLRSINEEADLHPVGRFITKQRFINLLAIRLRAEYWFRKHPEILEQQLLPAWIIVGLQRTGTTKLHRLLSADPDNRWLPSWEVINPIPIPKEGEKKKDNRYNIASMSARALKILSPGFYAIHPIEVDAPEEDILLLDTSFMSTTPEAMMNVPSYADWLEKTDQTLAYTYMVKLLKYLQWKSPQKRWILKTPHHLEFMDLIEKHFDDVHFLWMHRNVYDSIPSFLSMVAYNRMIFSKKVDEKVVARHWLRKNGYMLQKALQYRLKAGNESKFTDINYSHLIENSLNELSHIYKMNGGLKPELVNSFSKSEKENPFRKYGVHKYAMDDFGLTGNDITMHTSQYQEFIRETSILRT